MTKRIEPQFIQRQRELIARRDQHAHNLGVAYVEFEIEKARLLAVKPNDLMLRLGAALAEFEGFRNMYMDKVTADLAAEKALMREAFGLAGVNIDEPGITYRVDATTGVILRLLNDTWVEV